MPRLYSAMFKVGALLVGICSVLLAIAVLGTLFLGRQLSFTEQAFALAAAISIGSLWWRLMLKRLRKRRGNV